MTDDGILVAAGIDYCTATGSSEADQVFLRGVGFDSFDAARRDGNNVKPWAWAGYRGWSGGGVSLGDRHDGSILRLSGGRAASMGGQVIRSGANITRLDLQATVKFSRDIPGLADDHAQEVLDAQRGGRKSLRLRHQRGFGRGDTLYVGSRQSNYHGRVYDKYRESGDERYRQCWRYEVECKHDGVSPARQAIVAAENVEKTSAAIVCHWFMDRGCRVRYRPELAANLAPVGANRSDLDTFLSWLLTQVRPGVQRWLPMVGRDTLEEILFGPGVLDQAGYGHGQATEPSPSVVVLADQE